MFRHLNYHNRIHTGEKSHKCDICGARFQNRSNLRRHTRIHTGEKPYKCDTCGIKFGDSSNMITHARSHNSERRYGAVQFAMRSSLKLHICIPTREKPYKCTCGAEFVTSCMLNRHVGIHTLEKLVRCKICGAQFTSKCYIDINSRDEPYKCDTCDAQSAEIWSLKTEMHGIHGEHLATGFESTVPVCQETQLEMDEQDSSMLLNNSDTETTWALDGHELIKVEQIMKTDPGECGGNSEVAAMQWALFPGGVLKEVKLEHDGQTANMEVARSWVVCPGGVLNEVKTEHNE